MLFERQRAQWHGDVMMTIIVLGLRVEESLIVSIARDGCGLCMIASSDRGWSSVHGREARLCTIVFLVDRVTMVFTWTGTLHDCTQTRQCNSITRTLCCL